MRIGFGGEEGAANTHYRVLVPIREMVRRGHRVIAPTTELYRQAFAGSRPWDVVHVFRQITEDNLDSIRRLRAAGVAIVWDNDDDFSAIEKGSAGLFERRHKRRLHKLMVEMARSADLMTTTTERIARVYREEGVERIRVIPNYLDPEALRGDAASTSASSSASSARRSTRRTTSGWGSRKCSSGCRASTTT